MARQRNNSWSLVDDHGTWTVSARIYDEVSKKVVHRTKSTGYKVKDATKRKAQQAGIDLFNQMVELCSAAAYKRTTPLERYVYEWLESKEITVRANTLKSYRDYATVHILPELGTKAVGEITWRDLQRFCDKLLVNHAKSSVKKIFIVVRGALDDAVRDGAIASNPERLVKWQKTERVEKARALTVDETAKILCAAERAGEPLRAAVTLGLVYGLRRSEACGLRWIDIDFKKNTMYIRHTVTQNGTLTIEDDHTKTKGSKRVLSLVDTTVQYFKELRQMQLKNGLILDKVIAWPDGHNLRPDGISRMFHTMTKHLNIGTVRFHDLRHTAATLLANAGAPPKELQAFMGHDDISITLGVYVHASKNATENTSKKMSEIINESLNGTEKRTEQNLFAVIE